MGKSNAPRPPDPMKTAAAQTGTNIGSAIANSEMGMVNQVTPDGSLTYSQTGTYKYTDPYTGKTYDLPKTTATTTLSEIGQQIKGENDQTQLNMAQTGNQQSAFLQDYLGTPWNPDTNEIEGRLMELGTARLDPRFAQEEDRLRTRLENQGVTAGSEAWNREMSSFGQNKNDAFNQLMLTGRGQAMGELAAIRNQPLNEISSLMGGSQIVAPNFGIFQPQGAATTDVAGLINNNYNQRQQNWQQQNEQDQSLMGGLFSLGSSAIMASDIRLKEDIRPVGKTDAGLTIYTYRYKGHPAYHMGVMAQEAEKVFPQAVHDMGGYLGVDYREIA